MRKASEIREKIGIYLQNKENNLDRENGKSRGLLFVRERHKREKGIEGFLMFIGVFQ